MRPSIVARAELLAFLTAGVTLATQVLVHRFVSAKLVNNYAFLVISLTMLGFALSGVVLSSRREAFHARLDDALLASCALFGITLVVSSIAFASAATGAQAVRSPSDFLVTFLRLAPLAFLFAAPFAFCGLVLGLLLSLPGVPTGRVYGFDMLGSAVGAIAVIPMINGLGVERSLIAAAAVLLVGCLALTGRVGPLARGLAVASALLLAASSIAPQSVFRMNYPAGSWLALDQDPASGFRLEHVLWDPIARIEMSRTPPIEAADVSWPFLIGDDARFAARLTRVITQNNTAFTYAPRYMGASDTLPGIERTLYASAYHATSIEKPRVLVIGVGGGLDVVTALRYSASKVVGVEINAATIRLLTQLERPFFSGWVSDPRFQLVEDDGRHFLARSRDVFDVVQLTGVDSASGTPAAAHVFSESYIYTDAAFDGYLAHLGDSGIVNMMRSEWAVFPREMLRALVTATSALRRAGARRPSDHVMTLTDKNGRFTTLLVKKTPFSDVEQERLASWAAGNPYFGVSAGPKLNARRENTYQVFLALEDRAAQDRFVNEYPFDIRPATDARPFFFRHSFWWHLFDPTPASRTGVPVMELALACLFGLALLAALLCVVLPLRLLAHRGLRVPNTGRLALFFGGLGLGYLMIEMALLQKFGLFLGHPNRALSVVLASLLVASGIGALGSSALVSRLGGLRWISYSLSGLVLLEYLVLFPRLGAWIEWPFSMRVAVASLAILPIGVLLGAFFPWGLGRLKDNAVPFVPWAWGLNGIASVIAPIVSIGVSMTWGIDAVLLGALPVYLVVAASAPES